VPGACIIPFIMNSPPLTDTPVSAAALVQLGRRPGPFVLALDGQVGESALLGCHEVVRAIPGRRLVCSGAWQGKAVFIKLYLDGLKYWQAECRGLQALGDNGITAPAVLYAGTADHGALHVIVLETIQPAVSLEAALSQATAKAARIALLQQAVDCIASHHRAGLEQRDIHLNNFLLSGDQLYTLDGGGIHDAGVDELSVKRSRDNLALFFAELYPDDDALIDVLLPAYLQRRCWHREVLPGAVLQGRVHYFRRRRLRRYLKKVFRNCSAFKCERSWRAFRVYDRSMASTEMVEFLADPDASLRRADTRYLKQGNTCTLWTTRVDGRQLVVKRYNIKGLSHRLGRAFRKTRAAISWKNAHRLWMYGILTAPPVALVEERYGPLRGRAWYITGFVAGDAAGTLCGPTSPDKAAMEAAGQQVTDLLAQLALSRISHGDMKATNFILAEQGAVVIDLDAMQKHSAPESFRRAQRRDLARFMRNWEGCPGTKAMFTGIMRAKNLVTDT
jgi:tRNA A-37 threonylcarbamoyl transferase component Bud32